jgi:hypothetical protein
MNRQSHKELISAASRVSGGDEQVMGVRFEAVFLPLFFT